jgi:hypothetical protein
MVSTHNRCYFKRINQENEFVRVKKETQRNGLQLALLKYVDYFETCGTGKGIHS